MPHAFNVLGYHMITKIWAEKNGTGKNGEALVQYKYRFQRLDTDNRPWYAIAGSPAPPPAKYGKTCPKFTCQVCNVEEEQIYQDGFMCFNRDCKAFWLVEGKHEPKDPKSMQFLPAFLSQREDFRHKIDEEPYDLVPATYDVDKEEASIGMGFGRGAWKGNVCPKCNNCVARRDWFGWACSSCSHVVLAKQPVISAARVQNPHEQSPSGIALDRSIFNGRFCTQSSTRNGLWREVTYDFGAAGKVIFRAANAKLNAVPGGPDETFRALQAKNGIGLRRHPNGVHEETVHAMLTNHFSVNYGRPYGYVIKASADTIPFSKAPPELLRQLAILNWAAFQKVAEKEAAEKQAAENTGRFNEILVAGYFENGGMNVSTSPYKVWKGC